MEATFLAGINYVLVQIVSNIRTTCVEPELAHTTSYRLAGHVLAAAAALVLHHDVQLDG